MCPSFISSPEIKATEDNSKAVIKLPKETAVREKAFPIGVRITSAEKTVKKPNIKEIVRLVKCLYLKKKFSNLVVSILRS